MGKYVFILPDLGEGIVTTEIAELHADIGDNIEEDDNLISVITDKAVIEVPSPVTGKIIYMAGKKGDMVSVGTPLAVFEVEESLANVDDDYDLSELDKLATTEKIEEKQPHKTAEIKTETKSAITENNTNIDDEIEELEEEEKDIVKIDDSDVLTSPYIRRKAFEKNIDLSKVKGTGPNGRITEEDFKRYLKAAKSGIIGGRVRNNKVTEIPVIGMRRIIADKMLSSKRNIPHITYVEEVDVTQIEDLRANMNNARSAKQPKLTILPFLMLALVKAVEKYPKCNAIFDDKLGIIKQFGAVNIGIAAMTEKGLTVPVVKHVEAMDIWAAAQNMQKLSEEAKQGTIARDDLLGSTITITSLGKLGGLISTPIINAPEVAIIGVNKIVERPVVKNKEIVIRKMMNLSSSFDHRIIDGYDAAEFVNYIKTLLENPAMIFV